MESIVTSDWLAAHLNDADLVILDASVVSIAKGTVSPYENTRIKSARYFDLKNDFSDQDNPLPNTIPSVIQFQNACRKLGIDSTSKIVVYDDLGIYWSPRVWWMFKTMGHEKISVLDGGLPEWVKNGLQVEVKTQKSYEKGNFIASFKEEELMDFDAVHQNTITQNALVIDARSKGRFEGTEAEPRKDLCSGHIPNSINIPYVSVLNDTKFKSKRRIK